ncbi:MAG: peptidase S41, partial [Muribaculaceae bacterium]|nr:peptidase S41 [Muribaculaceae bacterium]
ESDAEQLAECRPFLNLVIKGLVGRDLFTASTYSRVVNPINPVYREALKLINDPERYDALLKGDQK